MNRHVKNILVGFGHICIAVTLTLLGAGLFFLAVALPIMCFTVLHQPVIGGIITAIDLTAIAWKIGKDSHTTRYLLGKDKKP